MANSQNVFQTCVKTSFIDQDTTTNPNDQLASWRECVVGKQLPEFSAASIDGKKIKSKDLKGKIVVLNLWFIDCLPCIAELPALNKLVEVFRNNKDVVFLSITWESKERIKNDFLARHKFDFQLVPAAQSLVDLFGKPGYPATFIFGQDGIVKAAWLGGPIGEQAKTEAYIKIKPVVDELLKQ